jgi:hypothetical protein
MWQRRGQEVVTAWQRAESYCADLTLGGYENWRLPSRIELVSIVEFTILETQPAVNTTAFPETAARLFWSSSPSVEAPGGHIWAVYFGLTFTFPYPLAGELMGVRCVRPTRPRAVALHYETVDDTVVDRWTGLVWQRDATPGLDWAQSVAHCDSLGAGWRAPSINEVQTLIDERRPRTDVAVDPIFSIVHDEYLWTGSHIAGESNRASFVHTESGWAGHDDDSLLGSVRCVRTSP